MGSAAARSKEVALLLVHMVACLLLLPRFVEFVFGPCFVMRHMYLVSFLQVCNNFTKEERAGCFTSVVFFLSYGVSSSLCRKLVFGLPGHTHFLLLAIVIASCVVRRSSLNDIS